MDRFCTICGTELVNGACPNCLRAQTAPQYRQPNTQYQPQTQYQQLVVNVDPNDERFKSFFMSPKEKFVCALGNGYLMNFLAGGFLGNGFAVISDKRVYFKGKSYEVGEKKLKVRTTASTVDLKDVTGTEVRTVKHIELLILGWICVVLGVILCLIFSFITSALAVLAGLIMWTGILCIIFYTNL